MLRTATPEERKDWDRLITANPDGGNVLQAKAFGELKIRHGWEADYIVSGGVAILTLSRHIPILGKYTYIPKGPGVNDLPSLKKVVKELRSSNAFCVRMDPEIAKEKGEPAQMAAAGLLRTRDIQYNTATVIVDLKPSEDEIIASFKQKTRYNIRLAAKKGVTVKAAETNSESMAQLYRMAKSTYERAGVYAREEAYFTDFWSLHAEQGSGQMFFAYFEEEPVAGAFITYLGKSGLYKDGASYRDHPELQAPYLMQWEIMRWLKSRGVEEYDLHGVPPLAEIDNPDHPLAGLARFKRGFNSEITEFIGTYDLVLNSRSYQLWRQMGERLVMAYEARRHHRLFY